MKTKPGKPSKPSKESRTRRPRSQGSFKNRRRAGYEALRVHRERLALVAQDTFHIALTSHGYHEDEKKDGLPDVETILRPSTSGPYHDLSEQLARCREQTTFYPHHSPILARWSDPPSTIQPVVGPSGNNSNNNNKNAEPSSSTTTGPQQRFKTKFEFVSLSTMEAARKTLQSSISLRAGVYGLGVLNTCSPKRPGGASLTGGNTLEECLVRQTTLYDALTNSQAGSEFYAEHRQTTDGSGLHDHAMLYSPAVAVIKDDQGHRIAPYEINVLSCVPVHAGTVRAKFSIDDNEFRSGVSGVMRERMARALRLFEERGDRVLILGAFGVGQSCNSPEMIGELWADLLCAQGSRFEGVFDKVVFALSNKHRETFEKAFNATVLEAELEQGLTESD